MLAPMRMLLLLAVASGAWGAGARQEGLEEALASKRDLWGERAMREPGGPSYAFFARLLPPLRYVNAEFRHYPIVLSAPGALRKARLVSNGSAVNARAGLRTWREAGFPVTFRLDGAPFGEDPARLEGPRYERGFLPVVHAKYGACAQEAFVPVAGPLAEAAAVFVRFSGEGAVSAHLGGEETPRLGEGRLLFGPQRRVMVLFDGPWTWHRFDRKLVATLRPDRPALLAIFTEPALEAPPLTADLFAAERRKCLETWEALLARGAAIEVPEPLVNDAWRASVIGCFALVKGDQPCYSAGNQYERLYEAECGDVARTLMLYGHGADAARMIPPLLDYRRAGLLMHQAAFKLQLVAHHYWVTRDAETLRAHRAKWTAEAEKIAGGREAESGLLPREQYAGDIPKKVYSLSVNANAWRGLRDMGAVLVDLGERAAGERYLREAAAYRKAILLAAEKSLLRDLDPPFLPQALFGEEPAPERMTATHESGYWDLMAPYTLGSAVFAPGSEFENAIIETFRRRGGLCMGMVRVHKLDHLYDNPEGVNDLYGLRYVEAVLRRDEPEHALVTFYGKLAQGMTRDTFIGAEGTALAPLDPFGRPMYLPPNSAANAGFLRNLRDLLVQDWDLDDDGVPETLRLLFATPRAWMEEGKAIRVERAPTAFGPVSVRAAAGRDEVVVEVEPPPRAPRRMLLRARLPGGRPVAADLGGRALPVDDRGTVDLSGQAGPLRVRFRAR